MNTALAQEYIRGRMAELGFGNDYIIRLRHYVLRPKVKITIQADVHFFLLVNPPVMVRVQSGFGIYDLTVDYANELQYEHQGIIEVENYASHLQHIQFIQIIIQNNDHANNRKV
ncbi:hypothetical protein ACE38W_00910 [Chitinophaga sp. Hz27]|uniref:hypothetical protein n=1 Tax=Chitinophaga sp. Hz27 TaxID=3347169 RepID=UPI0035D81405